MTSEKFCFSGHLLLTHWGRVTHICVGKLTIIGSDNGLSPARRQAITWTNAGILLIGPLGINFSEIWIGIQIFSFMKMHLKMSSAKWRPFCLCPNVLICLRAKPCLHQIWIVNENSPIKWSTHFYCLDQITYFCFVSDWCKTYSVLVQIKKYHTNRSSASPCARLRSQNFNWIYIISPPPPPPPPPSSICQRKIGSL